VSAVPGPFEVTVGCEEYYVDAASGTRMARCEADFNSAAREWSGHVEARARAEQICAALNLAWSLARMTDADRIAALIKALQEIKACAGNPARVWKLATLALAALTETTK